MSLFKPASPESSFEKELRNYLTKKSPVKYNGSALEQTISDVKALNDDLKEYVMHFLQTGETRTELGCDLASIDELLQTSFFTPVTAALFIQWYNREPLEAAAFLLHHDSIDGIPEELPPIEEETGEETEGEVSK